MWKFLGYIIVNHHLQAVNEEVTADGTRSLKLNHNIKREEYILLKATKLS